MRYIYLLAGIAFSIIAIIICFANVGNTTKFALFFDVGNQNTFFPLALMMIIGLISGFLYGMFFMSRDGGGDDDSDGDLF